jgi:hypothetical protein
MLLSINNARGLTGELLLFILLAKNDRLHFLFQRNERDPGSEWRMGDVLPTLIVLG